MKHILKSILMIDDGAAELPERARAAVQAQEDASERLIGWIQLGVVVTFGTLYLIAPTTDIMSEFDSLVPVALALYFLFTIGRLILSYRYHLPDWYLGLSGFSDLALLLTLIWSFHLQYEQPPPFYLKAPTMLYLFIFIALRALRFDPRYVLRTGIAAAIGWGCLVAYALIEKDGSMPVTRDYVEYLTSNTVLLGGEFDKIITILLVTVILTVALMRGRGLLLRAMAEESARYELSRYFPPEVAARITAADGKVAAGAADQVRASVLNVDIRGFTPLSESLPAPEMIGLLNDYQDRMAGVIEAHGGTVDRVFGDGVLATFGASKTLENYAARSLDAAQAILHTLDEWNAERAAGGQEPIRVGVAIATGDLTVGAIGRGERLDYTLVGEAVNLSAKLEKHTKIEACRALCDGETLKTARAQGWQGTVARDCLASAVAGVDRPLDLAVLA
jgi:adenylate cyclase